MMMPVLNVKNIVQQVVRAVLLVTVPVIGVRRIVTVNVIVLVTTGVTEAVRILVPVLVIIVTVLVPSVREVVLADTVRSAILYRTVLCVMI